MSALPFLKRVRRQHRLSQMKLAAKSGLTCTTVNQIEMGRQTPRWETVNALADALGVTPADLGYVEEPV